MHLDPPPAAGSPLIRAKMQAQRARNTKPEIQLRRELHARGVRFRLDGKLPGLRRRSADIVWSGRRLAVFVDGCFWHGCPDHFVLPKTHSDWWHQKIQRNKARDLETTLALTSAGWTVIRIWEHLRTDLAADVVQAVIQDQYDEDTSEELNLGYQVIKPDQPT